MRWKDSVEAAKNGEQNAFAFLYEQTYGRCRYIAGKYLKDDTDAVNDVLQDAYVKAFQNIGQLEDPEKFPGWLAMIVTNTALNELKKRKPLLFSQMSDEDQNLDFTDNLEDDRVDTQPELSMDQAETKRLVQEMLEALSDEQRICILMYYMEEKSVKEIAQILDVSENTVKSRLSYGRKAVKEKVLDLEKRGTKLYGLLPFPFFLYLFGMEAKACSVKGITAGLAGVMNAVNLTKNSVAVSTAALETGKAGGTAVTQSAIGKAGAGTIKAAVAGGVKVKVAAGVLAVGVAVGGTATVVHVVEEKKDDQYFSYLEHGAYLTELAEKQEEVEIAEQESLYVPETDMDVEQEKEQEIEQEKEQELWEEQEQEQEPVAIAADASSFNYEGPIQFAENNGDGTYLCYVEEEDQCYTLPVADDARMLMTSFSEGVDENYQCEIPGADFKKLPWGFEVSYGNFALYDFFGEFWGDAVIENGEIVYFNEYFRE